jgi:hypothetical protein
MAIKIFSVEQLKLNGHLLSGEAASPYRVYYKGIELAAGPAISATRSINAGDGLVGGGDLSADRTIDVQAGSGLYVTDSAYALGSAADRVHINKEGVTTHMLSGAGTAASPGCVTNAKIENAEVTITAGNGIQGGGVCALGSAVTVNVKYDDVSLTSAGTVLKIKDDGVVRNHINADVAGSGLHQQGDGALYVLTDQSTLFITAGTDILKIKDAGVTATQLATDSVTSVKILDDNVITSKILNSNVTNAKLANSATNFTFASGITGVAASTAQSVELGAAQVVQVAIDTTTLAVTHNKIGVKAGSIGNTQLGINYAGSASQGGDATAVDKHLTQGDGVTTFDYDGSVAKTVAVDATVVRTAGTQSIDGLKTWVQNATFNSGVTIGGNLTVNGTTTSVVSNEVNIGDSVILLNADIVDDANNATGGIAIKRLHTDDSTRKDALLQWNESTDAWEAGFAGTQYQLITKGHLERGTITLAATNTEKTITFANGYSATPTVLANLQATNDTDDIMGVMVTSATTTSAKVQFTAPMPNGNYKLNYSIMGF